MKNFPKLLLALISTCMPTPAAKLGTEEDHVRQALFACQSVKEIVKDVKDNTPGPFTAMAEAAKLADEGKRNDAIAAFKEIVAGSNVETRVQLWVWNGLRALGEMPDKKSGTEVLGAILEVPMQGGYDTLAAYTDGTARYLNFSGAAIFWEVKDAQVKELADKFIAASSSIREQAKPRTTPSLPTQGMQLTILTRMGNFVQVEPGPEIINKGAALMFELIRRSKQKSKSDG